MRPPRSLRRSPLPSPPPLSRSRERGGTAAVDGSTANPAATCISPRLLGKRGGTAAQATSTATRCNVHLPSPAQEQRRSRREYCQSCCNVHLPSAASGRGRPAQGSGRGRPARVAVPHRPHLLLRSLFHRLLGPGVFLRRGKITRSHYAQVTLPQVLPQRGLDLRRGERLQPGLLGGVPLHIAFQL